MCLKWQCRYKVPPNVRWVPSYDFSTQKVNVQWKFTNKLLLFMVTLWISKMWRSGAVNPPKEGWMLMTNKGVVGHLWSFMTFFKKVKEKFVQIDAWRYESCITSFLKCLRPQFMKLWQKLKVQKIIGMLGAQNVNGWSQNETDGFRAEVSHALRTGRMSFWTPLWLEMK